MTARYLRVAGAERHVKGWRPSRRDHRLSRYAMPQLALDEVAALPDHVDLESAMPPVKDQGGIGTCLAHSVGEALEYLEHPKPGGTNVAAATEASDALVWTPPTWRPFSRLWIYAIGREEDGIPLTEDAGLDMHSTLSALRRRGVCWESSLPYGDDPISFTRSLPDGLEIEASEHQPTFGYWCPDAFTCMASLAQGFPVAFGMSLPEHFQSGECLATGIVNIPEPSEGYVGGHSMLLIGYDRRGSNNPAQWRFKARNSWGLDVGVRGNFSIPMWYWLEGAPLMPIAGDNLTLRAVEL